MIVAILPAFTPASVEAWTFSTARRTSRLVQNLLEVVLRTMVGKRGGEQPKESKLTLDRNEWVGSDS